MQIDAKVIEILPLQTGEGKNGPWKKQDIIVHANGQYPKRFVLDCGMIRLIRRF